MRKNLNYFFFLFTLVNTSFFRTNDDLNVLLKGGRRAANRLSGVT